MPILQRNEVDFGERGIAFLTGVVDACSLSEYEGEIDGFQLRILLDDMHAGKYVYWKARIADEEQWEKFDSPKMLELFDYNMGIGPLIDEASDKYFIGRPVGVTIKPNPNKDDRFYVGIYKPKMFGASAEAKAKFRAKMGILDPAPLKSLTQQVQEDDQTDSNPLPF